MPYCGSWGSGTPIAEIFLPWGLSGESGRPPPSLGGWSLGPPKLFVSTSNQYLKLIIAKYHQISCKMKYLETLFVFRVLGAARQSLALPRWAPQGCWQCLRPVCRGNTRAVAWGQAGHESSALVSPSPPLRCWGGWEGGP